MLFRTDSAVYALEKGRREEGSGVTSQHAMASASSP